MSLLRSPSIVARVALALVLALAAAGCAPALQPAALAPAAVAPQDSLDLTLFLVGDAGSALYDREPVLHVLSRQLDSLRPVRRFVVFLGDNVYPRGVPPAGHAGREDAERKLSAQVRAIADAGAEGLLVPGNHDWDRQGKDGWNAIRRQDTLVRRQGGAAVRLAPHAGCPGPEVVDVGSRLRVIALDSEWWLHGYARPSGSDSPCATRTEAEVVDSLRGALRDRGGRHAIVVDHHPARSGGEHGGSFSLGDHIFPLRNVKSWLWIPLPIIGSLYPLARQMGFSNQDISGRKYQLLVRALEGVFAQDPPLVLASGHDHDLQVIRGGSAEVTHAGYQLVSGAGILGHAGLVRKVDGALFQRTGGGFMRLDFTRDGGVRLSVTAVSTAGAGPERASAEVYSLWLTAADTP